MSKRKEPSYAPGQELTLHPNDEVRGAELLRENLRKAEREQVGQKAPPDGEQIRF